MRVDGAIEGVALVAMDRVEQLRPREDAPRLPHQRRQQGELGRRHLDRPSRHGHAHPRHVEHDVAGAHDVAALGSAVDAPEDRAHPRHQLARAERLGQVVVGAELEADQLVALLDARGEHDDRHAGVLAQRPRHVEAVHLRQAQVEHDEIRLARSRLRQRVRPGAGHRHAEAGLLQVVAADCRDARLVVHDQDLLHRVTCHRRSGHAVRSGGGGPAIRSCARRCHSSKAGGTPS